MKILIANWIPTKAYTCTCISKAVFLIERKRLQHFVRAAGSEEIGGPLQLLQFIHKYSLQDSLPNLVVLLRIFLTRAISVASCERSFSKLKLIKNYLRSSMSQTRLSDLAILSIEREATDEIDFNDVISDFAQKKARKIDLWNDHESFRWRRHIPFLFGRSNFHIC